MKKIIYLFIACLSFTFLQNCEDTYVPDSPAYVTFAKFAYSTGVDPGASTSYDIKVFTADVTGADRSFDLTVDGSGAASGSYTVPASVTIPAGSNEATFTVALSDTNLGIGVNKILISFDHADGYSNSKATTLSYIQNCTEITGTLDFNFDYYSSETGWYITDALDGVVVEKAEGSYADGQWTASESITLCAGRDYTLHVTDYYSDGMNDGTNLGDYTLTIGGVVKVTGGGNFGAIESTAFDTN